MSIFVSNTVAKSPELNVPLTYNITTLDNAEIRLRPGDLIMRDVDPKR